MRDGLDILYCKNRKQKGEEEVDQQGSDFQRPFHFRQQKAAGQVKSKEDHKWFQESAEFCLHLFSPQEVDVERVGDDGSDDRGEGCTNDAECGDGNEQCICTQRDDGADEIDQWGFVGIADSDKGIAQGLVDDPESEIDHEDIEYQCAGQEFFREECHDDLFSKEVGDEGAEDAEESNQANGMIEHARGFVFMSVPKQFGKEGEVYLAKCAVQHFETVGNFAGVLKKSNLGGTKQSADDECASLVESEIEDIVRIKGQAKAQHLFEFGKTEFYSEGEFCCQEGSQQANGTRDKTHEDQSSDAQSEIANQDKQGKEIDDADNKTYQGNGLEFKQSFQHRLVKLDEAFDENEDGDVD